MDFKNIKKVALHRHLELSIRHSTIKELAADHGFTLSSEQDFIDNFIIAEPMKDLGTVLHKFLGTQKLLSSLEILERIAFEACEDAYKNENVRVLELRYAPTFVKLNHEHFTFDSIHQAFLKGIQKAQNQFPMTVGLICIIQRTLSLEVAEAVTQFAIDNKNSFIGLDLADDEDGFEAIQFSSVFKKAIEAGLNVTIHSGEAPLAKAPQYIMDAINHLGAQRIGHGIQCYQSEEVMNYLKKHNIPLEISIKSNWLTQAVKTIEDHPILKIHKFGVPITLNTDDPGIFDTDLNNEYEIAHKTFGFTKEDFVNFNKVALEHSFIKHAKDFL